MFVSTPPESPLSNDASFHEFVPLCDPRPLRVGDPGPGSCGTMDITSGDTAVSVWGIGDSVSGECEVKVQLQLSPDCPVVIGRSNNEVPPYLDPSYRPTQLVPGSGTPVVRSSWEGKDTRVSRAHFMLRGNAGGIVLTNGVPWLGGGIRPPMNGTWMLEPCWRAMHPGEEYQIEHGEAVSIHLPNRTVVRICAE
jgi:hypothetical protein